MINALFLSNNLEDQGFSSPPKQKVDSPLVYFTKSFKMNNRMQDILQDKNCSTYNVLCLKGKHSIYTKEFIKEKSNFVNSLQNILTCQNTGFLDFDEFFLHSDEDMPAFTSINLRRML